MHLKTLMHKREDAAQENQLITVDDKLNDPTNKCVFDLRNATNAL